MSAIPENLKGLGHYLKIANEHATRDPVVYYWCLVYAVELGMKLENKSPEDVQYLGGLLSTLEKVKKMLADQEAIASEIVGQAHMEQYALRLFTQADNDDRASIFNKNVVKLFYTSGHLMDTLATFGEVDEKMAEARKYAKYKAAYIHNCLRNGITPKPGPPGSENPEDDTVSIPVPPTNPQSDPRGSVSEAYDPATNAGYVPPPEHLPGPSRPYEAPPPPAPASGVSASDISEAQTKCKWANSALEYDDVPTAIRHMKEALSLLEK